MNISLGYPDPYTAFSIIAIGASLGGVTTATEILSALPEFLPVPIVVLQHRAPMERDYLSDIFSRRTRLRVRRIDNGDRLEQGTIHVTPPGSHLHLREDHTLQLSSADLGIPPRPSIDLFFESMASLYRTRALGVILTGSGNDGARGVEAVKRNGGKVIVQDQTTAIYPGMPTAALATGCVDLVLPVESIASAITALTMVQGAAAMFRTPPPPWAYLNPGR